MSIARGNFLRDISELRAAVRLTLVTDKSGTADRPGARILRRGAAIAGLVMLESFVRDRTNEMLDELQRWPAKYEDLPERFRRRATIDALGHLQKFARMLKGQGSDFESEVIEQTRRISSMSSPAPKFTKHFAGDYTGNLSTNGLKELLGVFHVKDCWRGMDSLGSDIGLGVPSVKAVLETIVRNRHNSAHVAGYSPAAHDMEELPENLNLLAICLDTMLSASVRIALTDWRKWERVDWNSRLEIFVVIPKGSKFRLVRQGASRATKVVTSALDARSFLPRKAPTTTRLLVEQGPDRRPMAWDIT